MSDIPVSAGDTLAAVQLSPCVGGLVRTWGEGGETHLWSVNEAAWLRDAQGRGAIGRTAQEPGRYREVGLKVEGAPTLAVPARMAAPEDGDAQAPMQFLTLAPAGEPSEQTFAEFAALLQTAIDHCIPAGEYLVVERGGWEAPQDPFVLFAAMVEEEGPVIVIETAPAPQRSEVWAPHVVPGRDTQSLSAPYSEETLSIAAQVMIEAIADWGVAPWDLAFTFGRPPGSEG